MFGRKKQINGYRVDAAKKTDNAREIENHYWILSGSKSKKNNIVLRHGEFLTEKDLKKFKVSKKVQENHLVPVTIEKKNLRKLKNGAAGRTTKEFAYGTKPIIRNCYKPNRANKFDYQGETKLCQK